MSRVLPILFNTAMVRATLDNRKTATRRLEKSIPAETHRIDYLGDGMYECHWGGHQPDTGAFVDGSSTIRSPHVSGDILYVRETWGWEPCWDCGMDTEEHNCCDESAQKIFNHDKGEYGCYIYRASFENNVYPSADVWHPSIHMPKAAARIWLKVTDVRLERLQNISDSDCMKEGTNTCGKCQCKDLCLGLSNARICHLKSDFIKIWNSTVKKQDFNRYGWDANPWVWVIEFERCEKPEGE